jgi:hypothetical protein
VRTPGTESEAAGEEAARVGAVRTEQARADEGRDPDGGGDHRGGAHVTTRSSAAVAGGAGRSSTRINGVTEGVGGELNAPDTIGHGLVGVGQPVLT